MPEKIAAVLHGRYCLQDCRFFLLAFGAGNQNGYLAKKELYAQAFFARLALERFMERLQTHHFFLKTPVALYIQAGYQVNARGQGVQV